MGATFYLPRPVPLSPSLTCAGGVAVGGNDRHRRHDGVAVGRRNTVRALAAAALSGHTLLPYVQFD
jgi:hypothetical protein